MGTQQKKKKRTKDPKSTTSEIKRTQDLDANRLALQPSFELGHSPLGVGVIDFIDVEDRIHSTQTGSSGPPTLRLSLSLDGNYTDASGVGNTISQRVDGANTPFGTPGQFGSQYGSLNWPNIPNVNLPDYILSTGPAMVLTSSGYSFACWIRPQAHPASNYASIFTMYEGNTNYQAHVTLTSDGELVFYVVHGGVASKRAASSTLSLGTWYHVAAVFNPPNSPELYLNGVMGTSTLSGGFGNSVTGLLVGALGLTSTRHFRGNIDEIKWYNFPLTFTQVNNLKNTNSI